MKKRILHSGLSIFIGLALLTACKAKPDARKVGSPADTASAATPDSMAVPSKTASVPDTASENNYLGGGLLTRIRRNCDTMSFLSCGYRALNPTRYFESDTVPDSNRVAADSLEKLWQAMQDTTFDLIQLYKQERADGLGNARFRPQMLAYGYPSDSLSLANLPKVQPSAFLETHPFFFIGAGPFLHPKGDGMPSVDNDLKGSRELRYCTDATMNTRRIMGMVGGFRYAPASIEDGGPIAVNDYEDCPFEKSVKGIGSMTLNMNEYLPVYFITENGMLIGRLAEVTYELFDSNQGCAFDQPKVCFGVPTLPDGEILGILIPYEPLSITQCKVTRKGRLWTADLTGDGVPELAGVSSSWEGIVGTLHRVIWYGNVTGGWTPIDSARDPDCT